FLGIEFPVARGTAQGTTATLGHQPGRVLRSGDRYQSRMAVVGASPAGAARAAFNAYIDGRRPQPGKVHFNYNSWWTTTFPFSEEEVLELAETFKSRLFDRYGEAFDSFTIDLG